MSKLDYLTDKEEAELVKFTQNPTLFSAVKKVLLAALYEQGTVKEGQEPEPLRNWAVGIAFNQKTYINAQGKVEPKDNPPSYEKIGQRVFAMVEGINHIEGGFAEILKKFLPQDIKEPKEVDSR